MRLSKPIAACSALDSAAASRVHEHARTRAAKPYRPRVQRTADVERLCAELKEEIGCVGWSETARRAGVDRTALHRAFSGRRNTANLTTIAAVANALGFHLVLAR